MRKRQEMKLGDLELQILNVLWERGGASTVREVLDALPGSPKPMYTTVLTMMRLMHEKGYLDRSEKGRAHVYSARLREQRIKRSLVRTLIDTAFRGSAEALLVRLLEEEKLSQAELTRIKEMIEEQERKGDVSKIRNC
jgi:BlaI family transcriptional regulator, penicillinase repressor